MAVNAADALLLRHRLLQGPEGRYLNRELSQIQFNARVLSQASDPEVPLLERVKFLAICSSNIDEFFQVRVAGLKEQEAGGVTPIDGPPPSDQLKAIALAAHELADRQSRVLHDELLPALASAGIRLVRWDDLDDIDRKWLSDVFHERIFPVLTPLAVDPGHPFPYISNLSLNLAVLVADPTGGARRFARVKVPPVPSRFIALPDGARLIPLEQVVAAHLEALFPGMVIECAVPFRVTRNADVSIGDEMADDLLVAVEMQVARRQRSREAVRLEIGPGPGSEVHELLRQELELSDEDVYEVDDPLDHSALWELWQLQRADLHDEPWSPVTQPRLLRADDESADLFAVLRDGDVLVHHPYDSFATSVEAFIRQAAIDPDVLAIKQTLYRTSGDSPIIKALIRAAERGKQVAALVELQARFDEQANIAWARALEEAGVHVVYGLLGLKTHSKTALVVRHEEDGIRRYCHIGTGNYNPITARLYEDIGILTADADIGADLTDLFNYLTGYSRRAEFRTLMMAPAGLRDRIVALIDRQADAGPDGRIVLKLNHLVDTAVIDALYRASSAGVSIDIIARTRCCLRPGVPGLSDNIRVRSIVGRYLEHSRLFAFGPLDDPGTTWLVGSADMMPRNLDRRVEVLVPVTAPDLQSRLREILDVYLHDQEQAWELQGDGTWAKLAPVPGTGTHPRLRALALDRARAGSDVAVRAHDAS